MYQIHLFVFLLLLLKNNFCVCENPVVEISSGIIQGLEATTFANTPYYSFQKIPYAAPPVGDLRFKPPETAEKWDDVLDATSESEACFQLYTLSSPLTQSEDCLYLNVYTPRLPENNLDTSLPVMLYIHGGAFLGGSSQGVYPDLFVDNGVILVNQLSRLPIFLLIKNILGFLSTQDEVVSGNNGLKDQRLAIQWTHDNIHVFGGDPEKITIFGESAGSVSVSYQVLNQESDGLFRAVILESGVSICPWAIQRNARNIAFAVCAFLNSTFEISDNSEELLQFLQNLEAEEVNTAAAHYMNDISLPWDFDVSQDVVFGPVIEVENPDAFITKKMYGLLQVGDFLKVPTLVGINSEENLIFNADPETLQTTLQSWDQDLDLIVPDDMQISDLDEHKDMAVKIRDIYTKGKPFGNNLGAGIRYSSDNSFSRPVIKYSQIISEYVETYFYYFSYDGEIGGVDIHYDGAESVGHSEDTRYLFCSGLSCDLTNYPENDQVTRNRLITIWTNFAKYLNPTPEPSVLLQNITWPQVNVEDGDFQYLDIGENLEIKNHPKNEAYQEWVNLYENLDIDDFDTF